MKQKTITIIFAFAIVLLGMKVSSASAATYYMRADGTAMSKAQAIGPATDKTKCMNVATHNAQMFDPGDVILLSSQGGKYVSTIVVPSSGESGNPIAYKNVNGETPILENNEVVTDWSSKGGNVWMVSFPFSADAVYVEGIPRQRHTTLSISQGQYFSDENNLYLYGDPTGKSVKVSKGYGIGANFKFNNKSNLSFSRNVSGTMKFEYSAWGFLATADAADIENVIISGMEFNYMIDPVLILVQGNGRHSSGTFIDNVMYRCNSGIRAYSEAIVDTIGYNTWIVTGNFGEDMGTTDGSAMWNTSPFWDKEYAGFQNARNCQIHKNVSKGGAAIFSIFYALAGGDNTDNDVFENYCYNTGNRLFILSGDPPWIANNNKVYSNIYVDDWTGVNGDDQHYAIVYDKPGTVEMDNLIVNNTISGTSLGIKIYSGSGPGDLGLVFKNNIVRDMSVLNIWSTRNDFTGLDLNNNLYADNYFYYGGYVGFEDWKLATGQDSNSLIVDPVFVNPGGENPEDYRLQTGSSAIGNGVVIAGLTTDFSRNVWGDPPSIGAFEYSSGTPQYHMADINQDANINVIDLGILMSDFGKSAEEAGNPRSDINSDGSINVIDLGIMMSEWE